MIFSPSLSDADVSVVSVAQRVLVPVFLFWSKEVNMFVNVHCNGYIKRTCGLVEVRLSLSI